MTWESRFQVTDPVCGLVEAFATKTVALAVSRSHAGVCEDVQVFDLMATPGRPNLYDSHGHVIGDRPILTQQEWSQDEDNQVGGTLPSRHRSRVPAIPVQDVGSNGWEVFDIPLETLAEAYQEWRKFIDEQDQPDDGV